MSGRPAVLGPWPRRRDTGRRSDASDVTEGGVCAPVGAALAIARAGDMSSGGPCLAEAERPRRGDRRTARRAGVARTLCQSASWVPDTNCRVFDPSKAFVLQLDKLSQPRSIRPKRILSPSGENSLTHSRSLSSARTSVVTASLARSMTRSSDHVTSPCSSSRPAVNATRSPPGDHPVVVPSMASASTCGSEPSAAATTSFPSVKRATRLPLLQQGTDRRPGRGPAGARGSGLRTGAERRLEPCGGRVHRSWSRLRSARGLRTPDRVRYGDAHPCPGRRLLYPPCLALAAQPGRDVRRLESRGQSFIGDPEVAGAASGRSGSSSPCLDQPRNSTTWRTSAAVLTDRSATEPAISRSEWGFFPMSRSLCGSDTMSW